MTIILITIWLIIGLLSTIATYYSAIKDWYLTFRTDYRKSRSQRALDMLICFSPIFIMGGVLSLMMFFLFNPRETRCLYFKIPKS